jgi:hypothetical protein
MTEPSRAKKRGHHGAPKGAAIYHVMRAHETFEETAQALWTGVADAIRHTPGYTRYLVLEIEGHRNQEGGFDRDALEIQTPFVTGTLSPYLTEISMPLLHCRLKAVQRDDMPVEVIIRAATE